MGVLIFIGIKIFLEIVMDTSLFVQTKGMRFRVLPSAHILGFTGALITGLYPALPCFFNFSWTGKHE